MSNNIDPALKVRYIITIEIEDLATGKKYGPPSIKVYKNITKDRIMEIFNFVVNNLRPFNWGTG